MSRQKELEDLFERRVFQIVKIEKILMGTRIFACRFVDTIKLDITEKTFEKPRLVV